jgi:hypothetical protein
MTRKVVTYISFHFSVKMKRIHFDGGTQLASVQMGLSPGLELSMTYQLNVLAIAVMCGGPALLQYEKLLIRVIGAAFDTPLSKVILSLDFVYIVSVVDLCILGMISSCCLRRLVGWFFDCLENLPYRWPWTVPVDYGVNGPIQME